MTRPTPATPPETTARTGANGDAVSDKATADDRALGLEGVIAAALSEHGPSGSVNSREGWVECECDERLHLPSGLTFDGYPEMWEEERKARDAHVAAHVAEQVRAHLAPIEALLVSEDANAVLYGVTGIHPESYGGVTKDEALECAGELVTNLRAVLAATLGGPR